MADDGADGVRGAEELAPGASEPAGALARPVGVTEPDPSLAEAHPAKINSIAQSSVGSCRRRTKAMVDDESSRVPTSGRP